MSALGQKQTSTQVRIMSALPPKADIRIAADYVRPVASTASRYSPRFDVLHVSARSRPASPSPSIGCASSTLYRLTGWASIPSVPATTPAVSATTPLVRRASSALYRPTSRASIPCPMARLSIDRRERFNRDCTNTANRQDHFRRRSHDEIPPLSGPWHYQSGSPKLVI